LLLPAIDLLEATGQTDTARRLSAAVEAVLTAGTVRPPDLGGHATTEEMTEAVIAALA
jgi:isocitrate/isopropylmalate dehydrogenase